MHKKSVDFTNGTALSNKNFHLIFPLKGASVLNSIFIVLFVFMFSSHCCGVSSLDIKELMIVKEWIISSQLELQSGSST